MKKIIVILLSYVMFLINLASGQKINDKFADLNFIESKIKKNYPSYSEKQNRKYLQLLSQARKNLSQTSDPILNFQYLLSPVMFFKDLHLRLASIKPFTFDSIDCKNKFREVQRKAVTKDRLYTLCSPDLF
mgnify:CR=1 FL=1